MSSLAALRMERTQSLQPRAPVSRGVAARAAAPAAPAPAGPPRLVPREVLEPKETLVAARGLKKRWDVEAAGVYVPGVVAQAKVPTGAALSTRVPPYAALQPREALVTRHQVALSATAAESPAGLVPRERMQPREALVPRDPPPRATAAPAFTIAVNAAAALLSSARCAVQAPMPREQLVSRHELALRATEMPATTLTARERLVPREQLAPREMLVARTQCDAVAIPAARIVVQQLLSSLESTAPMPREQLVSRHELALRATEMPATTLTARERLVPREQLAPREMLVARTQCTMNKIAAPCAAVHQVLSSLISTAPVPREQLVSRHELALRATEMPTATLAVREQLVPRDALWMVSRAPSVRDELTACAAEPPVPECDEEAAEAPTRRRKSVVAPLAPAAVGVDPEGIPITPMLSALADPDDMGFFTPLASAMDAFLTPLKSMHVHQLPAL